MKKHLVRALAVIMALSMVFALAACGESAPATTESQSSESQTAPAETAAEEPAEAEGREWRGFHGWLEEDWDSKTPEYQFTGYWDMGDAEYGIAFSFLMNLYNDGSVLVNQFQAERSDYRYYGSWEKVEDPDGDELHINIVEESGGEIESLIDHKYSYVAYEESDGNFSFGYDFGIAGGQYFRVANVTGSAEVNYASIADFQAAAAEGAFVTAAEPAEGEEAAAAEGEEAAAEGEETAAGYTAKVVLGDQEFDASLVLNDETSATFTAAVAFECSYEKLGNAVILTLPGEPEGFQAQIWPAIEHVWVVNDEDMTMQGATAAYDASGLVLITFADGTMRVEFPEYSMARDGFTYELSEDGTTLTVTGTPDADAMGAFQQVWDGMGGETWTIDGNAAAKAE